MIASLFILNSQQQLINELMNLKASCLCANTKGVSALLCCYHRNISSSGEQIFCCSVNAWESHRCTRCWAGTGFLRWNGVSIEIVCSPKSCFKLFNAAVCVGQPVSFVTADCRSTPVTVLSESLNQKSLQLLPFIFDENAESCKTTLKCAHCTLSVSNITLLTYI